jgi:hypothetical protein
MSGPSKSDHDWFKCRHDWRSALERSQALAAVAADDTEAREGLRQCLQPGAEWYFERYAPGLATQEDVEQCINALVRAVTDFNLDNLLTVWQAIVKDYTQQLINKAADTVLRDSTQS